LQDDELVGRLDRQLTKQNRVHQAEDRRVRADAERETQHGERRKRLLPAHRAQRIAYVSNERIER
jgi:hypothetical protein